MTQIQSADPGARRTALLLVAIAVVVGVVVIVLSGIYQPKLEAWILDDTDEMQQKLNWVLFILIAPLVPFLLGAIYFWRFGSAVTRAARFPPPDFAVVRDTPVIEGSKAIARGRLIKILAVLLAACFLGLPVMLWLVHGVVLSA